MIETAADRPAIAGGSPRKSCPYGRERRYGEEELRELREALDQGTLFYASGKKVKQLEAEFARRNGVTAVAACSSGTAAIHAALAAIGVSPGDEVITSPITDIGTLVPILYQGAVPVFADLDPYSFTMLPASVEALVTSRTRAVLAVHLWGNACDLDALSDLCARHGLSLVEDCAQALGCRYHDRPIGTIGHAGCFSLNEFKHISCGDGGLVITQDADLGRRLRLATDKAYDREPGAVSRHPAFLANNYRMTELQGAVALAQLRKLDSIVERRQDWCSVLNARLLGVEGITLPRPTPGCDPSWWFYMMRVEPEVLGTDADGFAQALRAEGLPVGAHYIGQCVYEYPLFAEHTAFQGHPSGAGPGPAHPYECRSYHRGLCPTAETILDTCVILSINEAYTTRDLDETVCAIERTARWFRTGA